MFDTLSGFFDTTGFPPRWQCGEWTPWHGWIHILSDLAIWSAYFAIPCVLVYFVKRRQDVPFRKIFWLFGAFILACGTTHLMEAIIFWYPHYRLAGAIKVATALVSWTTVLALIPAVPQALAMRSPDELQREIDARRRAEAALQSANADLERQLAALRASEERFRLLVDGTRDYAIFMLDPAGKVASWNPGAERITGYSAHEIIERDLSVFYLAEDVDAGKPEAELRMAALVGRHEDEGWRLRRDGSRFWANVILTALRDETGELRGFSKITRDMTEKLKAEESSRRLLEEGAARRAAEEQARVIAEERERLGVTLRSIGDGVIATDATGRVTLLNPVAEALTGWSGTEAVGRPLRDVFSIIDEENREHTESPVDKVLREGAIVVLGNHAMLVSKNGSERPVDDSAAPVKDERGNLLGVVLVFRDVTERRRAQKEILALNRDLKRRDQRKDEFLATLAHELRNPLAPLRNGLELMKFAGNDAEALAKSRGMMERQLGHLVRLVDDLLDVSRINEGRLELRKERVALASVVAAAVESCEPMLLEKGDELSVSLPDEPLHVDGDQTRLAQTLSNLLTNAVKYSESGSRIEITVTREGSEAVLVVKDNGIGIPLEMLSRVFEPFTQVATSLENARGGLGIGLTIVKRLVEMHGGTVEARSEGRGKGSEFLVRLPLASSSSLTPTTPASIQRAEPAARRRILVVDDNADSAESLSMLLARMGHEVRTAGDGLEAVQTAESFRPELVFLDLGMPKLNGCDACRRIREQPGGMEIVIVALSGWGQEEDKRRSREAGFNDHLVKPIEAAVLNKLLEGTA